ncbi:MAG: MBL fold metallo-hydrolase [Deltaproteobacteria bacterium GWC2_42_11]|nr:MAG: MBL fold metallo-hydrolase [Deltaproteobacteria bacterium GWC2_42_11]HBO84190.1 MBL fold metallo-hydrolase [Deltaproteobacteria bacterium]
MILEQLVVGPLDVNCYLVGDDIIKDAVCIDPGGDADVIYGAIKKVGLQIRYIINTHGHFDHTGGNELLKQKTGASIAIHKDDVSLFDEAASHATFFGISSETPPKPDMFLNEGDIIRVGRLEIKVIHTPGHTKGGVSLFLDNVLFTGDTLFAGSVGRTDFPGGSLEQLISSIKNKLLPLGDSVVVYPGHGPTTTIGKEKKHNTFLTGE